VAAAASCAKQALQKYAYNAPFCTRAVKTAATTQQHGRKYLRVRRTQSSNASEHQQNASNKQRRALVSAFDAMLQKRQRHRAAYENHHGSWRACGLT